MDKGRRSVLYVIAAPANQFQKSKCELPNGSMCNRDEPDNMDKNNTEKDQLPYKHYLHACVTK